MSHSQTLHCSQARGPSVLYQEYPELLSKDVSIQQGHELYIELSFTEAYRFGSIDLNISSVTQLQMTDSIILAKVGGGEIGYI